jgi:hypothetical protein
MRNSMLSLLQPRPKVVRRKENALNDARRKGETRFTVGSGLSTLIKRTMKAPSRERMRRIVTSLVT